MSGRSALVRFFFPISEHDGAEIRKNEGFFSEKKVFLIALRIRDTLTSYQDHEWELRA